jgi:peptidoglycan/LPS O-acetylase OafA/YrhL
MKKILHLRAIERLQKSSRNSAIDFYRGIAILTVMFFHFGGWLKYGYLGVDLFFVVSGFLIGKMLLKELQVTQKIKYGQFILKRGLKIWPSYYFFLVIGLIIANVFLWKIDPSQIIPPQEWPRYFLYYRNYTGGAHWMFDHVWSLCVEEHFYTLFPLLLIFAKKIFNNHFNKIFTWGMGSGVLLGILAKIFMFYFTKSQDTYAATHNRIDALSLGIILAWLDINEKIPTKKTSKLYLTITGILIIFLTLFFDSILKNSFYNKVVIHSIVPWGIFLLLLGSIKNNIKSFYFIRFTGYYTYNLYLWHPMMVLIASHLLGYTLIGMLLFLLLSFGTAILVTSLLEEPILEWRNKVLPN